MESDGQKYRDELIVVRCQLGEREALDALVERWHPPLCGYIRGMVDRPEQGDETLQETWVRVLSGLARLRDPSRFEPWLYRIARCVLMDRLRLRYRASAESAVATRADPTAPDPEDIEWVRRNLACLPLIERETIMLYYINGLSVGRLAEAIGVPEGTVKSRLSRGRRMLRGAAEGASS